jgi:hypothetical protein
MNASRMTAINCFGVLMNDVCSESCSDMRDFPGGSKRKALIISATGSRVKP